MCSRRSIPPDDVFPDDVFPDDGPPSRPGPYDGAVAEEDLWFLPGPQPTAEAGPGLPPPRPSARVRDWAAAEAALAGPLARLTLMFGELDTRLRGAPGGLCQRLALMEAADLSWWAGDRLAPDRLGLWTGLRIGATEDSAQALGRAGWAVRRLSGGPAPAAGLAAFLDRPGDAAGAPLAAEGAAQGRGPTPAAPRGTGSERDGGPAERGTEVRRDGGGPTGPIGALGDLLDRACGLHPVTQAAALFRAWRGPGGGATATRDIEAAVLAARHAASMARLPGRGAPFLPLALGGAGALQATGPPAHRLAAWIAGAERASLGALLHLDRLEVWRRRAAATTADLSGRTPPRLLAALAAWPLLSAPLAEAETGASRAAVQRNLDRLSDRGLIREVTGQGRYRVWTAALHPGRPGAG